MGLGGRGPLKICRRGQNVLTQRKMSHSFIRNCCSITLQVSHHQGWKNCNRGILAPGSPPAGFGATTQRFFTFSAFRRASAGTIILLVVDYHAATWGGDPLYPLRTPLEYLHHADYNTEARKWAALAIFVWPIYWCKGSRCDWLWNGISVSCTAGFSCPQELQLTRMHGNAAGLKWVLKT